MIGEQNLFSPLYKPFSGRWPISGMMRNGVVYELPMQEHHTTDSESLSLHTLRTPSVTDGTGGAISETQAVERGRMVKVADQMAQLAFENGLQVSESIKNSLLPTPVTTDGKPVDVANQVLTRNSLTLQSITAILDMPEDTWEKTDLSRNKNRQVGESAKRRDEAATLLPTPRAQEPGSTSAGYGDCLNDVANRLVDGYAPKDLLPTPTVGHVRNHDEPVEEYLERRQDFIDGKTKGMPGASLGVAVRMEMLPTPQALEGHHGNNLSVSYRENQGRQVMLSNHAVDMETNWGKFEPAITRWESLTRPAPAPTKPDGKDGNHRLSAEFTEWMMGLPEGWVTAEDIGLKRNDQLKACGNGVVPQQAELALRILLQDITI
jgi:DNA (cytosine-5)-methyltransferase 1